MCLPPPQKGLESSSQIKFFFLGWQAAHRIPIVGIPVPLILLPHAVRELARPSKHTAHPYPFNTSVPVRLPPQKGLESSSGSRQQALGIAVRIPVRLPSTETSRKFSSRKQAARRRHRRRLNARPSTERSRKFFSNKVFLLGVAGSTQNRHSRHPCPFNTSVPVRLPPQKGLESSSGSRQQALGIAVRIPVRLPSTETSRKFISKKSFSSSRKQSARRRHRRHPNARPSTERSRKFFSNKVFLLGVAGSTQYRHSRRPCPFNTSSACCPRAGTPK